MHPLSIVIRADHQITLGLAHNISFTLCSIEQQRRAATLATRLDVHC
jgi:hypothetical protein